MAKKKLKVEAWAVVSKWNGIQDRNGQSNEGVELLIYRNEVKALLEANHRGCVYKKVLITEI